MQKQTKKNLIIGCLIFLGIFSVYQFGKMFAPGSYPYAEIYEINASEEVVINAIKEFKELNPDFIVPPVTINNSGSFDLDKDEGKDSDSHWNINYFYIKNDNKIALTWTRTSRKGKTDFAFVSINEGLDIGQWKNINNDFSSNENRELKNQFEEQILNPIKRLSEQNKKL